MDERYQDNQRIHKNDSGYNENNYGRPEPKRYNVPIQTDPYDANMSSHYYPEDATQRFPYPYGDSDKDYQIDYHVDSPLNLKRSRHKRLHHHRHRRERSSYDKLRHRRHKHRRSKDRKKKKRCKCWRKFRHLFRKKSKHRHRHHRRKTHHRRREWFSGRRRSAEVEMREQYPTMQEPSSPMRTARELTKISSRQLPDKTTSTLTDKEKEKEKQKEEKAEKERSKDEKAEKETKEKATKSTSLEHVAQKKSKTASKTKGSDEQAGVDDEQQMRRKIIQFINKISTSGLEGIRKEFASCRSFIPNAVTKTAHEQNLIRCRYPDVICIDQTRIVLRGGDEDSDFIHASRVPLGNNANEIIITQLPLSNTVKHFWEMVWQENVQAILLLLTLNEWKQHAEKIQLIPEKGRCLHIEDFMMLTHKSEISITPEWLVREFYLSKNDQTRRILWHHYNAWEPNRAPASGEQLWPIHSSLRKMRRPYVCMSLAGAGRAGTYAAIEWAHEMLHDKKTSTINIAECVRKVRTYRMHAVQNTAQFQFIYMGIQRHIFLVEKIRKEILANPATFEATKRCSAIEHKYYQSGGYPTEDDFDL